MKAKLWLLCLALVAFAQPAQADLKWFDDPAETSGDSGGTIVPSILPPTPRSADESSGMITSGDRLNGMLRYRVTTFTGAPVVVLRIEVPDPEGTWQPYCETAAVAAGSTTYTWLIATGANITGSGTPGITGVCARPMPSLFRVTLDWTSGTSINLRVDGFAW